MTVNGDFTVAGGGTKNFAIVDPTDPSSSIYYAALEGPEAGTYYRGSAETVGGQAVIDLPGYFSKITESEGLTVQITPLGGWHQLYVVSKSPSQIVVGAADGGDGLEFDFFVQGIRLGYSDYQVERPISAD